MLFFGGWGVGGVCLLLFAAGYHYVHASHPPLLAHAELPLATWKGGF